MVHLLPQIHSFENETNGHISAAEEILIGKLLCAGNASHIVLVNINKGSYTHQNQSNRGMIEKFMGLASLPQIIWIHKLWLNSIKLKLSGTGVPCVI